MPFSDIKGHEKVIQILQEHIVQDRLPGAYLFSGPEGLGKKLVARTLAKAVNCQVKVADSCDRCPSCLKIEKNQHPDVHIIDFSLEPEATKAIKIEYIRLLQKEINLKPYEAEKKFFIINNTHNLTEEAANAFLKTLEEPPEDSLIVLVSHKRQLLFKTIISRCQILKFHPLSRIKLKQILRNDYALSENSAHFLAYFSEGRLGYALRLKDTDILDEKNKIVDEFASVRNLYSGELSIQGREDLRNYLNILTAWFRDIYLIKTGLSDTELINLDRKAELLKSINRYTFTELNDIFNYLSNSILYLEQNINIKLLLSNLKAELWRE